MRRRPDRAALRKLCDSEFEPVRSLARARLAQEVLYGRLRQAMDPDQFMQDVADEWFKSIAQSVAGSLAGADAAIVAAAEAYSDPNTFFQAAFEVVEREGKIMWLGVLGEKNLRDDLSHALERRERGRDLADGGLHTAFKCVRSTQEAVVVMRNDSKVALHHCFIIARLGIDRAKVAQEWAKQKARDVPGIIFLRLLEIDDQTIAGVWKVENMRWAYESVDRGSTIYLDSVGPGASVEIGLAPLFSLMLGGGSASIEVFADEGAATASLSVPDLQAAAEKQFKQWARERR